jgi:4-hydroxymandelate oxidase
MASIGKIPARVKLAVSDHKISRREALESAGAIVAGTVASSAMAAGQAPAVRPAREATSPRLVPREDIVNVLEYEEEAKRKLAPAAYALVAGGDRGMMDRITLRPRMLSPVLDMDLGVTLFGERHFTPILVAPISDQKRFHADGELATAKGATAGKTIMVVSSRSSVPLDQIAAVSRPSFWYQVYSSDPAAKTQVQDAVKAGAKAIVITVGAAPASGARSATASAINWAAVDAIKQAATVPLLVKGITTPAEANAAVRRDVQGIVVSNFGGLMGTNKDAMILALPNIVDAVGGKLSVLTDGSFRRGTDILKALALGAQGVMIGRPIVWGLSAYGEAGVQGVVEMLQTELARYMGMCGKSNLKALGRELVKIHGPLPS